MGEQRLAEDDRVAVVAAALRQLAVDEQTNGLTCSRMAGIADGFESEHSHCRRFDPRMRVFCPGPTVEGGIVPEDRRSLRCFRVLSQSPAGGAIDLDDKMGFWRCEINLVPENHRPTCWPTW